MEAWLRQETTLEVWHLDEQTMNDIPREETSLFAAIPEMAAQGERYLPLILTKDSFLKKKESPTRYSDGLKLMIGSGMLLLTTVLLGLVLDHRTHQLMQQNEPLKSKLQQAQYEYRRLYEKKAVRK